MSDERRADDLIVVVDQGTSSAKFAAFDLEGHLANLMSLPTEIHLHGGDTMEASPERWWSRCAQALRGLLSDPLVRPGAVRAVGLCGMMHTFVPVDAHGRARTAVPLWADQRYRHGAASGYRDLLGQMAEPSASSCVGRLAWMFETDASLRSSTRHLLPVKDYLRFKLTGAAATDYYEAEGTGLAGGADSGWSPELVGKLGLKASLLPPIVRPDELVGHVTAAAAEMTGLPAGTPVVAGTTDWHAALIGSDAVRPRRASLYLGTAGVLGGFRSSEDLSSLGEVECFGAVTSTGSALDWLAQLIAPGVRDQASAGAEAIAALAERSEPGAHGIVFLPHLMGERGDKVRPYATAAFTGLRLGHDRCDLARAAVEGTAIWLKMVAAEAMAREEVEALVLSGGGASASLNATINAALYGMPVVVPEVVEAGALGVAVLAARGIGAIDDVAKSAAQWVRTNFREEPSRRLMDRYADIFDGFARTEAALKVLENHASLEAVTAW
jgi:xylulokinase